MLQDKKCEQNIMANDRGVTVFKVKPYRPISSRHVVKLRAAECYNPRSLINHFVAVTNDPDFCMGTTLLCIDTPYILLPLDSILSHLGKLAYTCTPVRVHVCLLKFLSFPLHPSYPKVKECCRNGFELVCYVFILRLSVQLFSLILLPLLRLPTSGQSVPSSQSFLQAVINWNI